MFDDKERATELPKFIEKLKNESNVYNIFVTEELDLVRKISLLANKTYDKDEFGKLLGELVEVQEKKINIVAELMYSALIQATLEKENQGGFFVPQNNEDNINEETSSDDDQNAKSYDDIKSEPMKPLKFD